MIKGVDIKWKNEDATTYLVVVDMDFLKFSCTVDYSKQYAAWGVISPKNKKGYDIITMSDEFREEIIDKTIGKEN